MRLESIHQEVISFERFVWRCLRYALIALLVLLVGLLPGDWLYVAGGAGCCSSLA